MDGGPPVHCQRQHNTCLITWPLDPRDVLNRTTVDAATVYSHPTWEALGGQRGEAWWIAPHSTVQ